MSFRHKAASLSKTLSKNFGTAVHVTGPQVERALELMHGSDEAVDIAIPYANGIVKQIGLKSSASVREAPHKKLIRIFSKAIGKYDGVLENVPDIGRFRILVEGAEDILAVRKMFLGENPRYDDRLGMVTDSHPTNSIAITEFEDFYWKPSSTGRMGIHISLNIKIPGKEIVPVEIQILHKDMVQTEEFTRDNYLSAQKIMRTAATENRPLTTDEEEAVENYNSSSVKRYTADGIRLGLIDLRRPDLCCPKAKRDLMQLAA